jgi:hypothetical protein
MTAGEPAQLTISYQYPWFPIYGKAFGTGTLTKSETILVE